MAFQGLRGVGVAACGPKSSDISLDQRERRNEGKATSRAATGFFCYSEMGIRNDRKNSTIKFWRNRSGCFE